MHAEDPAAVDVALGVSELLPMVAILPFMLYQLAGFGTLHFVVPGEGGELDHQQRHSLCLIIARYVAYREGHYILESRFSGVLVIAMVIMVFYGVLRLKRLQAIYDAHCPPKASK